MSDPLDITCPYCGTAFAIAVDTSEGAVQDFIYDCENCCRPIAVHCVAGADGTVEVSARAESDA